MKRLQNNIALVTGAGRAIGRAVAERFINEGATVIIGDIDDKMGKQTAAELGENAEYMHLNVALETEWQSVIAGIVKKHGRLDLLVNNAGVMGLSESWGPQDPEHCSLETWDKVMAINLDGVFLGCKHAIQTMKLNNGGVIVNIGSRSGLVGVPTAVAYAASKAAIHNHTKSVALYCAQQDYNIRCNSIAPANIMTPMWEHMLGEGTEFEESLAKQCEHIPLHRYGEPSDVADAAVYLASQESKYLTGTEILVDGGVLAGTTTAPKAK
tara:strand:- start:4670 stop:5473 length:804 start_codon:yes stop_codon:yes gene_type:complete